jgi:hypothetical protein
VPLELLAAAGLEAPGWTTADEAFAVLAAQVREFEGCSVEQVGLLGVMGRAAAPAGA